MEYLSGGSLRPRLQDLSIPQVFGVLEGILAGLEHAEEHGIVHRDLKPENVLVTAGGSVKIADFGIARAYTEITSGLTRTGSTIGTPAYMAPEQATNQRLGPFTDLYAVGVIGYEMLAGRPPFDPADTPVAVLYKHVHEPVPPLAQQAPGAPAALTAWVEGLLEKNPRDRPQSSAEAWRTLEEIAVSQLGPYWRREARLLPNLPGEEEPAPTTHALAAEAAPPPPHPTATAATVVTPPAPAASTAHARRRRTVLAGAGALAVCAAGLAVLLGGGGESDDSRQRRAAPFDFDGDGRQEIALALPGWTVGDASGGGVALFRPGGKPTFLNAATAGVPGEPELHDEFGSAAASSDFDGDGRADLAIGAPGTNVGDAQRSEGVVAVLYNGPAGLGSVRRQTLDGSAVGGRYGAAQYGAALAGGDLNGDRYDDLVVGAPGARAGPGSGSGAIHIVFGSAQGLSEARVLRRPASRLDEFGSRLRIGDVDGDGDLDLAEGAPRRLDGGRGHASWCRGTARGPRECRVVSDGRGVVSVEVADLDGDGRAEVIEGDPGPPAADGVGVRPSVRIYRGEPQGPGSRLATLRPPRGARAGSPFGSAVVVGRLDGDRFPDLAVTAPATKPEASRVVVFAGGPDGPGRSPGRSYLAALAGMRGASIGRGATVLKLRGPGSDDLVVGVTGSSGPAVGILVLEGGGEHLIPRGVTRLHGLALPPGKDPEDARVRLARPTYG
jgi:hypothetical protein